MHRREFFKLTGLAGLFALTVDPMRLLASEAPEIAVSTGPPQAPGYWITTFEDHATRMVIRRAHCMVGNEEYGLERHIPEMELKNFGNGPQELFDYTDELLVTALSNAIAKVGAPRLNKCVEIREWKPTKDYSSSRNTYTYQPRDKSPNLRNW